MGNDVLVPSIEIGRIIFRSWEHEWLTDDKEAPSIASARRLLPNDLTRPVYEILERWEQELLRSSLPFSPYGLRIRPADNKWMDSISQDGEYHLIEMARRAMPIRELCPSWDQALPHPRQKRSRYGLLLEAPSSDARLNEWYEVKWQSAVAPETVDIDKLLRRFSPRYKDQPIFGYMPTGR